MVHVNNIQKEKFLTKSSSENLDKDGLVILVKNLIKINSHNNLPKLPNDFDSWTVKKQHDWINQNIANFLPNLPQSLLSFIPAIFCELDYDRSSEKLPKWMDMDKYRKGQKFAQKHFTALIICKIMGLMYFYSFDELLKAVILGEHIHTPYLAFKRFMLVIKRIFSWYSGDPWVKGTRAFKDMEITRMKHLVIRRKVRRMDNEKIAAACTFANPWCPDRDVLQEDFAAICPSEIFEQHLQTILKKLPCKPKGINNADLALVQSCLIVAAVLYPQNVGIHDATDEDLEAFCHVWKCYGYFLGIKDEYNSCRGNLEEIKQRLRDVYQYWVIPNFKKLTPEWEHVTRCLVTSLNYYPLMYMPYKVMTLMATDALNLNMPHLYASLNFTEWIVYKIYKIIFYSFKFSIVRTIANKIIRRIYDEGTNFNVEKLEEIHEKSKKIIPDFSLIY